MPDSILDQLRTLAEQIRSAEAEGTTRKEMLPMWRARRELVRRAIEDERPKAQIGRALGVSRERVSQLAA